MEDYEHNKQLWGDKRVKHKVPLRYRTVGKARIRVISKGSVYDDMVGYLMNEAFKHGALILPMTKRKGIVVLMHQTKYTRR